MKRNLEALLGFLESRAAMPYAPGRYRNDCVSFAAGAVRAQTGRHLVGRHKWYSEAGARRILKRLGGLEAALDARFRRIPPAQAMRGDIALVGYGPFGEGLMIVEGETLAGPGAHGIARLPRGRMLAAWSAVLPPERADG